MQAILRKYSSYSKSFKLIFVAHPYLLSCFGIRFLILVYLLRSEGYS
ncbi:hypothetical protein MTBUT4_100025 [Magnetospirillum sp. UT-4]|nr:hypothetical protein MTBUT4_100025 [Magnetospirillum sp. UT-4]